MVSEVLNPVALLQCPTYSLMENSLQIATKTSQDQEAENLFEDHPAALSFGKRWGRFSVEPGPFARSFRTS